MSTSRGSSRATSRSRSSPPPPRSPRHLNIERNDDRTRRRHPARDRRAAGRRRPGAACWPGRCYLADRARPWRHGPTAGSGSSARPPTSPPTARSRALDRAQTAAVLAIEGAHALEDDPANVEVVFDAGFRMMSPTHFFDNAFGGSAHGVVKGGLTAAGREMIERMEALGMIVDVAHASAATIDDVLAMATRPVVASHTGVRGRRRQRPQPVRRRICAASPRPAGSSASGSGTRPRAATDAAAIARSIALRGRCRGRRPRRPGSDFDGAVPVPVRCDRARPDHRRAAGRRARTSRPSARSWAATPCASLADGRCPDLLASGHTSHPARPFHGRVSAETP